LPLLIREIFKRLDIDHASFARQQDTYLNVMGEAELITAVRNCWISLFTDRAILYRIQNGFDHRQVALSVVVQQMVLPQVSGIMFTADPLTGERHISTIDASYGLGEALVAGLVSADLYKVNRLNYAITDMQIADKQLAIRPLPDGGVVEETITGAARTAQVLSEAQVIILAEIGSRIARHYRQPQDIEWALTNGKFTILQSRPITSLFPIPEGALRTEEETGQLQVLFSFASVQGVMGPITPLGQDTLQTLLTRAGRMFNIADADLQTQRVAWAATERLWINFTALVRHPIGRKIIQKAFPMIDSEAANAMEATWDDPRLKPNPDWFKPRTFQGISFFMRPVMARVIRAMRQPDATRDHYRQEVEVYLAEIQNQFEALPNLLERLDFFYGTEGIIPNAFPFMLPRLLPAIVGGMASLTLLTKLSDDLPPEAPDPLIFTRGVPHNVTTEMDLALWQTAKTIQADEDCAHVFMESDSNFLSQAYLAGELPQTAQTAVSQFMAQYGMRGVGEIDIGQPRWRENPAHIMQVLQSYLRIDDPNRAPDVVFARGAAEAEAAIEPLQTAVRATRFGKIKEKLVPPAVYRLRALSGGRETPKFMIIRMFGVVRQGLLESGKELTDQGLIQQPEDLFYLRIDELYALAAGEDRDWIKIIADRKATADREKERKLIPRLLLSDGRAFYEGVGGKTAVAADGTLVGSPVSPGVVEGIVHIIFNPYESQLEPGEILVCPGTDPAWTPLFLAAGGLVMEVGGLMTHGSVVAREYGIPAVVGVSNVTTQLKTGQRIRVDGTAGTVTILDNGDKSP
ncbi:MAG: phosphoenolpyruvate synthase, partial [Aquificales bacterium]|nr:phosphoenolpyruvate synthase [Aquificales bacterium]